MGGTAFHSKLQPGDFTEAAHALEVTLCVEHGNIPPASDPILPSPLTDVWRATRDSAVAVLDTTDRAPGSVQAGGRTLTKSKEYPLKIIAHRGPRLTMLVLGRRVDDVKPPIRNHYKVRIIPTNQTVNDLGVLVLRQLNEEKWTVVHLPALDADCLNEELGNGAPNHPSPVYWGTMMRGNLQLNTSRMRMRKCQY